MQRVTVTRVNWKDGQGAKGPWTKIGIQTREHGDKWFGCFENKYNSQKLRAIQEGSVIEIIVEQSGDFFNFRLPSKMDVLEQRVEKIERHLWPEPSTPNMPTAQAASTPPPYPYPEDEGLDPEDIPF